MKKILIIALTLLSTALYAQEGIQFEHGTWKDALAKAKAQKKLVFVDVYTSWCGPCKLMAKDIFPLKTIGDKFNSNFINYKIDAEKGEGIDVAKTYKVNAYPTYLFVNGDGTLYYTTLGAMPEAQFMAAANNALTEFQDPKPLPVWEAEFASRSTDKEYLLKYLHKLQKLGLKNGFVADQYITLASKEEVLSKENLTVLLQLKGVSIDGAFYKWLNENRSDIDKVSGLPPNIGTSMLLRYAGADVDRAIEKRDAALMERIIALRAALTPAGQGDADGDPIRMTYYSRTRNEKELNPVLKRYAAKLMNYDMARLKAANDASLKRFEEAEKAGAYKGTAAEELEVARKFFATTASIDHAYRVRALAEAALKVSTDKKVLNEALTWLNYAAQLSDNFTMPEVTAGVLAKLGKKAEAIRSQEKAIEAYSKTAVKSDVITGRLTANLAKIKENKPTWTTEEAVVTVPTGKKS